jgi:hypothetical protein
VTTFLEETGPEGEVRREGLEEGGWARVSFGGVGALTAGGGVLPEV